MSYNILSDLSTLKPGARLYLCKSIQCLCPSILRRKEFVVTTEPSTADYFVVESATTSSIGYDISEIDTHIGSKFIIKEIDLLRHVKTTVFSREVYDTINGLFATNDSANWNLALSLITTVDWTGEKLYLVDLLFNYYHTKIAGRPFRNSVVNKCFFTEKGKYICPAISDRISLYNIEDYYSNNLVQNRAQVLFLLEKYKSDFSQDLALLCNKYNLKLNNIDLDVFKENSLNLTINNIKKEFIEDLEVNDFNIKINLNE